jgi:hypothetical protein
MARSGRSVRTPIPRLFLVACHRSKPMETQVASSVTKAMMASTDHEGILAVV